MPAYDEGVLTRILVEEGASVPIGTPIAVIGEAAAEGAAPSPVPAPDETERALIPPPAPLAPPAIINPPQAAILAVGEAVRQPGPWTARPRPASSPACGS